jgi:hypothetical protein
MFSRVGWVAVLLATQHLISPPNWVLHRRPRHDRLWVMERTSMARPQ